MIGQRFGELTVVRRAPTNKSGNTQYLCRCSCGRYVTVRASKLRGGKKTRCHFCVYAIERFEATSGMHAR